MTRKVLIAGIDPGTTTAYAILDGYGKLVNKNSGKNLEINSLIKEITDQGLVLAVGTDKRKAPSMVERFAIKVGARLISPEEDLLVKDKIEMIHGIETRNSHEEDALASAILAFREVSPLLRKIRFHLKKISKEHLMDQVSKIVFERRIPIREAVLIVEKPEEIISEIMVPEIKPKETHIDREIHDRALKEIMHIRRQNNRLKHQLSQMIKERALDKRKTENVEQRIENRIAHTKKNVNTFYDKIAQKESQIVRLSDELNELKRAIYTIEGKVVIKKLESLAIIETERKIKSLSIQEGDFVMVDDANIYSESSLELLEGVRAIISKKQVSSKTRQRISIALIDAQKLELAEFNEFALCDKKALEQAFESTDTINRIIENYKDERKRMIKFR